MKLLKKANGNMPRTEEEKLTMINEAAVHYGRFLTALGFDWKADQNTENTPKRYAKSFVKDLIAGCLEQPPDITAFPSDGYDGIVLEKNIPINSMCSHHNREISGICHIAYIPGKEDGRVIGLSKLNRVAEFYSRRPQIQEGLTTQIHEHIDGVCENNRGVAVIIEASHGCVRCRGVKHTGASMTTSKLTGYFFDNEIGTRNELFNLIRG
jgi:GTP cyclohydrolase I